MLQGGYLEFSLAAVDVSVHAILTPKFSLVSDVLLH